MKMIKPILPFVLSFLIVLIFSRPAFCQYKTDTRLEKKIRSLVDSFHGTAGIYVRNLKTGREASVNGDSLFPTASIIKIPIMVGIFNAIEQGQFTYHQALLYRDSAARGGSGLMQFFKDSTSTDLATAVSLMISYSDNTSSVWCEKMAGGGAAINQWLAENGFTYTRLNARTTGREEGYRQFGWGQTTPREMAELLVMIREGKVISKAACERMYRNLTHIFWDENALSQIPPYVQAASKQGMLDASKSEVVLVNAPHGDYVFYVATKNNKDRRWKPDNEGSELERRVSELLWNYFEPHSGWKPAQDVGKYFY